MDLRDAMGVGDDTVGGVQDAPFSPVRRGPIFTKASPWRLVVIHASVPTAVSFPIDLSPAFCGLNGERNYGPKYDT